LLPEPAILKKRRNRPLKELKYLLLAQFGLLPSDELKLGIKRYARSAVKHLRRDLLHDFQKETVLGHGNLYVLKLIPYGHSWGLPNLRVQNKGDINRIPDFLSSHRNFPYEEVWYCKTRVDPNVFSVAGRFVFLETGRWCGQLVEQVWRCSPRLLEHFSSPFGYPYVRASRPSWGWSYTLDMVWAPPAWGITPSELRKEFQYSMELFERDRDRIERFLTFLASCGYKAYSIEYKIVSSRVMVIDWDTPNDAIAIERFGAAALSELEKV
jgi:hypothetical protein